MNQFDTYYNRPISGFPEIKNVLTSDPFNFTWLDRIDVDNVGAKDLVGLDRKTIAEKELPPGTLVYRSNKYTKRGTVRRKISRDPDTFEFIEYRKIVVTARNQLTLMSSDTFCTMLPPVYFQGYFWFDALQDPTGRVGTLDEILHSMKNDAPFIMGSATDITHYDRDNNYLHLQPQAVQAASKYYEILDLYLKATGKTQIERLFNTMWIAPGGDKKAILRMRDKLNIPLKQEDATDEMLGGYI